jgi:hypothetical protein
LMLWWWSCSTAARRSEVGVVVSLLFVARTWEAGTPSGSFSSSRLSSHSCGGLTQNSPPPPNPRQQGHRTPPPLPPRTARSSSGSHGRGSSSPCHGQEFVKWEPWPEAELVCNVCSIGETELVYSAMEILMLTNRSM